jgi:hypothetical protein
MSQGERRCLAVGAALRSPQSPRLAAAGAAAPLDEMAARLQHSGQLRSLRTRADGGLELVVQALAAAEAERQWRAQSYGLEERCVATDAPLSPPPRGPGLRVPTLEERRAILREFF